MDELMKRMNEFYKDNPQLALVLVGAICALAGSLLTKALPALWSYTIKALSVLGKSIGGRFAFRSIQDAYLNWVVLQNQDLNLTGIVGSGEKPKLEQVFISLKLVKEVGEQIREGPNTEVKRETVLGTLVNIASDIESELQSTFSESVRKVIGLVFPSPKPTMPLFVARRFWWLRQTCERTELQVAFGVIVGFVFLVFLPFYGFFMMPNINNLLAGYGAFILGLLAGIGIVAMWNGRKSLRVFILGALFIGPSVILFVYLFNARALILQQSPMAIGVGGALGVITFIALVVWAMRSTSESSIREERGAKQVGSLLSSNDNVAILGKPGAGKSTYVQFIALTLAQEKAGERKLRKSGIARKRFGRSRWYLPIFIPLRKISSFLNNADASRNGNVVINAFRDQVLPSDIREVFSDHFITHMLRRRRCLFLLDGLDEVADDVEFQSVTREILGLISRFPGNKIMVTSRYAGWRGGLGSAFRKFEIENLNAEQIRDFIDCWYAAVEENKATTPKQNDSAAEQLHRKRRAEENAGKLHSALEEVPSIESLAENPLLLSIICFVHYHKTLPKERLSLYQDCSNLLLVQWDREKGLAIDDTHLTLARKEAIMQEIAFALHSGRIGKQSGGKEATGAEIIPIVEGMLNQFQMDSTLASPLFKKLIDRSGIMVVVERFKDRYAFSHLTFQEFYTARYIHENHWDIFEMIARLADAPSDALSSWWREVVLLHSGMERDASRAVSRLCDGDAKDLLKRHLQIAAQCLSEAVTVSDRDAESRLLTELLSIRSPQNPVQSKPFRTEVKDYFLRFAQSDTFFSYVLSAAVRQALSGSQASDIVPSLVLLLESVNPIVKVHAAEALSRVQRVHPTYPLIRQEILQELVQSGDPWLILSAVRLVLSTSTKPLNADAARMLINSLVRLYHFEYYWDFDSLTYGLSFDEALCDVLSELVNALSPSQKSSVQWALASMLCRSLEHQHGILVEPHRYVRTRGEAHYVEVGQAHLKTCAACVMQALLKLDDNGEVLMHKKELQEAVNKGTKFQQAAAIGLIADTLGTEEFAGKVILPKLAAPFSEVRLAALAALPKLRIDKESIEFIRRTLAKGCRDFSRLDCVGCHCAQMIIGKGNLGLEIEERIRAIETVLTLDLVPNGLSYFDGLTSLYSKLPTKKRWEVMKHMPEKVICLLPEAQVLKILEMLDKEMPKKKADWTTRQPHYLGDATEALANLAMWRARDASSELTAKLFEMANAQDTFLASVALRSLKKSKSRVVADSAQHKFLLQQLQNRDLSVADAAFDILLENQLV